MGRLIRIEFLGSPTLVGLLVLSVVLAPFAFFYVLRCSVIVVDEVENPSAFLERWKARPQR